jgi:predicted glycoside hydrolase/deacetylase ChbG (UPF0249 family)
MTRREFMPGLAAAPLLSAQQDSLDSKVWLIVKGDDMGAAHGINTATIRCFREGIVRATDVIVPGPWFLEAAALLRANPALEAGVHLTLTSEWEHYKWRPLTAARSLVDRDGYFFAMTGPREGFFPGSSFLESKWKIEDVEAELRAQIETARRHIQHVSFLSAHMGAARATPELRALTVKLAAEYRLPFFSDIPGIERLRIPYVRADDGPTRARKLAALLDSLAPGVYTMIDHAATDTPEMQAIGHHGYRDVARDRSAVMQAWTSRDVLDAVARRGIQLTSYREVLASQISMPRPKIKT